MGDSALETTHLCVIELCGEFNSNCPWHVGSAGQLFRKPIILQRFCDQCSVAGFGEPRPQILDECAKHGFLSTLHKRIAQRYINGLPARDLQQMLLAAQVGDFDKILV